MTTLRGNSYIFVSDNVTIPLRSYKKTRSHNIENGLKHKELSRSVPSKLIDQKNDF